MVRPVMVGAIVAPLTSLSARRNRIGRFTLAVLGVSVNVGRAAVVSTYPVVTAAPYTVAQVGTLTQGGTEFCVPLKFGMPPYVSSVGTYPTAVLTLTSSPVSRLPLGTPVPGLTKSSHPYSAVSLLRAFRLFRRSEK